MQTPDSSEHKPTYSPANKKKRWPILTKPSKQHQEVPNLPMFGADGYSTN